MTSSIRGASVEWGSQLLQAEVKTRSVGTQTEEDPQEKELIELRDRVAALSQQCRELQIAANMPHTRSVLNLVTENSMLQKRIEELTGQLFHLQVRMQGADREAQARKAASL